MIHCPDPEHDDSNPSCSVNLSTGSWRCFGCESKGSFASLISLVDGVSLEEATRRIRGKSAVKDILGVVEQSLESAVEEKIFSWKSFLQTYPPVDGTPGETYLKERGVESLVWRQFGVRWGRDQGRYRERVILPMRNEQGKLVCYAGRAIHEGMVPKTRKSRSPKRVLYGLYELCPKSKPVAYSLLVEGEFDVLRLRSAGLNAVGAGGTAGLSARQCELLRAYFGEVVLTLDGDEAGRKAQAKWFAVLRRYVPTVTVSLPDGRDPGDLGDEEIEEFYGRYRGTGDHRKVSA